MNICLRRQTWSWVLSQKKARQGFSVKCWRRLSCALAVHLSGDGTGGACKGPTSTHGISHNGTKPSSGSSVPEGSGESSSSRQVMWGRAVSCLHSICRFWTVAKMPGGQEKEEQSSSVVILLHMVIEWEGGFHSFINAPTPILDNAICFWALSWL